MLLSDFTLPDRIFIDANIWTYFALRNPKFQKDCTQFLERIEQGKIKATTSNFVLNEVVYVVLIGKGSEILQTDKIKQIKEKLKKDHCLSSQCYKACAELLEYINVLKTSGLELIDAGYDSFAKSLDLGKDHRLLPADALHAATCEALSIKHLATNDSDFERIQTLTVWKPQEVNLPCTHTHSPAQP